MSVLLKFTPRPPSAAAATIHAITAKLAEVERIDSAATLRAIATKLAQLERVGPDLIPGILTHVDKLVNAVILECARRGDQ